MHLYAADVITRPDTPSRHNVKQCELEMRCDKESAKLRKFKPKVAWYKATKEQEAAYSNYLWYC